MAGHGDQGDWQKPFCGKKIVKDSTYTYHILYFTCPPPSTLIPTKWNSSHSLKERKHQVQKGCSGWSLQNFPLLFSHSPPSILSLGISKTPKVLTLFSHLKIKPVLGRARYYSFIAQGKLKSLLPLI